MKYMLLLYADESAAPDTLAEQESMAPPVWHALLDEMEAAGAYQASGGLTSITNATTVRVRDRKTLITDGPFAETHEQLGGFFILKCKDLDEALGWAGKIPAATYGSVEVRPMYAEGA